MKRIMSWVILMSVLFMANPLMAEPGRYQAVPFGREDSTGLGVFILDTKEGHCWTFWKALLGDKSPASIIYEGKVRIGSNPGENVQKENLSDAKKVITDP